MIINTSVSKLDMMVLKLYCMQLETKMFRQKNYLFFYN